MVYFIFTEGLRLARWVTTFFPIKIHPSPSVHQVLQFRTFHLNFFLANSVHDQPNFKMFEIVIGVQSTGCAYDNIEIMKQRLSNSWLTYIWFIPWPEFHSANSFRENYPRACALVCICIWVLRQRILIIIILVRYFNFLMRWHALSSSIIKIESVCRRCRQFTVHTGSDIEIDNFMLNKIKPNELNTLTRLRIFSRLTLFFLKWSRELEI